MKKFFPLLITILLVCCGGSSKDKSFSSLIADVPITTLPVGVSDLGKQSAIKVNWEHPDKMDMLVEYDSANKYGLNMAFIFDDLDMVNHQVLNYSLLSKSGEMIFAKRLPPINDSEFLIYFVRRTSDAQPDFPLWVLLMVDQQGVVLNSAVIGGIDCKENDRIVEFLFYIDHDKILIVKAFAQYDEDESAEDGFHDSSHLYEFNTSRYTLSFEGIVKVEPKNGK